MSRSTEVKRFLSGFSHYLTNFGWRTEVSCFEQPSPFAIAIEPWMHPTKATATQPVQMAQNSDQSVVKKIVQQQLGRSKQFSVRKIAVASGYALVSWLEGEAGGQALLQRQSGTWKILTHGGGWLGLHGLKQAGVPQPIAERLLIQIDPKWRNYEQ